MTQFGQVPATVWNGVTRYCHNHRHPLNAVLHVAGVPMTFFGLFQLTRGHAPLGWSLIATGYALQYFGHRAQGNEVGEVTLAKRIWRRVRGSGSSDRE